MGAGDVSGGDNISIGRSTMCAATSASENISIGATSMRAKESGADSIAIGRGALGTAAAGAENIAIGTGAMGGSLVTGAKNIGIGKNVIDALTSGTLNVAIGTGAMGVANCGSCNTAVGNRALDSSCAASNYNSAFGSDAGQHVTGGGNNLHLGQGSGANPEVSTTTQDGIIALGNHQATVFYATIALTVVSDARDKTDVADLDLGLDYIKALRPVYYRWDKRGWYDDSGDPHGTAEEKETYLDYEPDGSNKRNRWEIGLLAQEVLAAEKLHTSNSQVINEGIETVANEGITVEGTNEGGYQIQYQKITMPLIKATKELDAKIVALTARVADLE
jgi:hypothetical protein